jgi:Arc-like DNA binding domain
MLEELRQVAKRHNRSLNGEILTAIHDHIRRSKKEEHKRD